MHLTCCTYRRACARSGWPRCRKVLRSCCALRLAIAVRSEKLRGQQTGPRRLFATLQRFSSSRSCSRQKPTAIACLAQSPNATPSELRQHMALLMKWLHPDSAQEEPQSIFVNRVTLAWDDLKTPERRAAYDHARQTLQPNRRPNHRRQKTLHRDFRMLAQHNSKAQKRYGFLRRALLFLFGGPRI